MVIRNKSAFFSKKFFYWFRRIGVVFLSSFICWNNKKVIRYNVFFSSQTKQKPHWNGWIENCADSTHILALVNLENDNRKRSQKETRWDFLVCANSPKNFAFVFQKEKWPNMQTYRAYNLVWLIYRSISIVKKAIWSQNKKDWRVLMIWALWKTIGKTFSSDICWMQN